ncbi:unnamed protein product [Plutella xylostella]|uniref:(diamondback moth) hypothetical protein n=1 Tax=Plutella xylostella TaxID=51655 RepID=A0A8S4ELN2_PLUXY|nr:unnamed protein product [Plutella xylostella]
MIMIINKREEVGIGWRTTNQWLAGNFACKFFQVIRAFGLYLSSNVLVCISLDRFFAVLYPLRLAIARKRSKTMLACSWIVALLCSAPQVGNPSDTRLVLGCLHRESGSLYLPVPVA